MKDFRFRKTTMRNNFTTIFGGVGVRRVTIQTKKCLVTRRSKMQMVRRAHQGWRNKTFGSLHALKIRLKYGRRKPVRWYRT